MILSSDKDFAQLQKYPNVDQYSPILKKHIKEPLPAAQLKQLIIRGDKGDGIPNILSPDDCFITETRQKPITAKKLEAWETISPDDFHNVESNVDVQRNFNRNRYLIDFEYIPDPVRNNILGVWVDRPIKDRSQLLNYFMEHKMKNMIDHLGEF
jgi:hypothetical protein